MEILEVKFIDSNEPDLLEGSLVQDKGFLFVKQIDSKNFKMWISDVDGNLRVLKPGETDLTEINKKLKELESCCQGNNNFSGNWYVMKNSTINIEVEGENLVAKITDSDGFEESLVTYKWYNATDANTPLLNETSKTLENYKTKFNNGDFVLVRAHYTDNNNVVEDPESNSFQIVIP